jgi:hypothetical protein
VCSKGSELTRGMPADYGLLSGSAVTSKHEHQTTILQSLILLGLKQLKKQGVEKVLFEEGSSMSQFLSLKQWGFASFRQLEFDSVVRALAPT